MKAQDIIVQRVKQTLRDICSEQFNCDLELDGLIGITLGKKDVFLVKINEVIPGADETRSRSPNSIHYQNSPVALTEEHADDLAVNVPSKRHCAQSRIMHSPKRRKPEDQDDSEPQDLSQRTHSPAKLDFTNTDSNSRDSPAGLVRIPSTESNSSNSQWKGPDHMEQEDTAPADDMDEVTTNLANQNMAEQSTPTGDNAPSTQATVVKANDPTSTEKNVLVPVTNTNQAQGCFQCQKSLAALAKMKKELLEFHRKREYYTSGENPKPRPGCIPPTVAEHYKMQAFVSGSGVYVYPDEYRKLMVQLHKSMNKGSKPPASWLAFELLSMFYNKDEYKQPVIEPVDPQVKDTIITLAIKEGTGNRNVVSAGLDKQLKKIREEMFVGMVPGQPIPYPYVIAAPPAPPQLPPQLAARSRPPTRTPASTPAPTPAPTHGPGAIKPPQSLQGLSRLSTMVGSSSAPSSPPGRRREENRAETSSMWPPPSRTSNAANNRPWARDMINSDPTDRQSVRPDHDASYYSGEPGYLERAWRDRDPVGTGRSAWSSAPAPRSRSPGPISRPQPSSQGPSRGYTESTDRYWRC